MPRIAYVQGRYLRHAEAGVPVEDRGYQFADGVYEVVTIQNGHLVDEAGHLDRLERSLDQIAIAAPMSRRALGLVMREMIRRNRVRDGLLYLQITRGTAPRDFKFPASARPTLVMTVRRADLTAADKMATGVAVITIPDIRWKRPDIKSISMLPQVLGKQQAAEAGAFEAWQVDEDGFVTEGCSSSAWILNRDGVIVTRDLSTRILAGVTRKSLLRLIDDLGYPVEERPFSVEEAYQAREAFLTSATTYALPITRIDDRSVGNGHPGEVAAALRRAYVAYAEGEGAS